MNFVEVEPQGINPAILILEIKVLQGEGGPEIVDWKPIEVFEKDIERGQYKQVDIRGSKILDVVEVED